VAQALAAALGLTYISNDAIIWRAGWIATPRDERAAEMDAATRGGSWTFDGNLTSAEDLIVLERCDTLVWLDLPRWQVWSQVLWRTLGRLLRGTRLWHDNVESWRMFFSRESILLWSVTTFARRRRQYDSLFADPAHTHRNRIRLRSRREVDRWLASLGVVHKAPADVLQS
jgi:adenylate kinase family enzyme